MGWIPTRAEREAIYGFRGELEAYEYSRSSAQRLGAAIDELDNRFEPHSPNLGGTPITPASHDERLAKYITLRDQYNRDLQTYANLMLRVQSVLNKMDPEIAKHVVELSLKKKTVNQIADEMYLSPRQARTRMDQEILRALEDYETVE
ncbi:MAG: hypothetical protein LKF48_07355 [Prevotella sp.]|jgi:hypothetical protein|nr:hypothetical protein [Prevotella sp.]MCH4182955.1 hypothetical protein [Prevotella sp.]